MKTTPAFALFLTFWLGDSGEGTNVKSVQQLSTFHSLDVGETLTLQCSYKGAGMTFYWYKQTLGEEPRVMSVFYQEKNGNFYADFKDNPRFRQNAHKGTCNLTISDLKVSDSATYYCVGSNFYDFEFAGGTTVAVRANGSDQAAWVYQAPHEPGRSLECTVRRGACEQDHSVYWFRDSEDAGLGLFYGNDGCEGNPGNHRNLTCVYSLSVEHLEPHSGIYYCAVSSCGQILFGNGTKYSSEPAGGVSVLVFILIGALAVTTTLMVFLLHLTYKMKRNSCQSAESAQSHLSPDTEMDHLEAESNLNYAAFMGNRFSSSRRTINSEKTDCVYSRVK